MSSFFGLHAAWTLTAVLGGHRRYLLFSALMKICSPDTSKRAPQTSNTAKRQFMRDLIWPSPRSVLCNTELISHSCCKIVLLLYCCIVRKCIALGPHLTYPGINYTLIKHLTVCLIKWEIIGRSLEHFCLEDNNSLSAIKILHMPIQWCCSCIASLEFGGFFPD